MDVTVELRGVTKRFGEFSAVKEIDLSIYKGEFLTLLGPSGCGKTTLLRLIAGFETPTEGTVWLEGKDVTHEPPYRRDVNQVFQSYALFPHLNVEENIGFGLRMQKKSKVEIGRRVEEIVALISLDGMERRRPSQLSGGQRQRVALARALICEPKVLLLDEPLSALDAKLRHQMQMELKRLQKKLGITFVFVTHDQEEALTMSDRIAVVNKGRIEQLGESAQIYHSPRTTFVADFIGKANIAEAEVIGEEGTFASVRLSGGPDLNIPNFEEAVESKRVLLSIRPEKIHLQKARQRGDNVFEAEVIDEIFKGAMDQLELRTKEGLQLIAIVANESATQETFHKGEKVWCQLHPSDIVVVRSE